LIDRLKNRPGVESRVEQRCLAGDFVPDQIAVHLETRSCGCDLAQLSPEAQIALLWQPTARDALELPGVQSNLRPEPFKVWPPDNLAALLQLRKLIRRQARCFRRVFN